MSPWPPEMDRRMREEFDRTGGKEKVVEYMKKHSLIGLFRGSPWHAEALTPFLDEAAQKGWP